MIDQEVETVLREIRERVTSQPNISAGSGQTGGNGNVKPQPATTAATGHSSEPISLLNAHLTTTARAWDRLPPIFSNRSGTAARIELWIKARLKALTRWFTWEQVNFNAAVHHALGEILRALNEQQATIDSIRAQLVTSQTDLQNQQREITALRGELEAGRIRLEDLGVELRTEIEAARSEATAQVLDLENEQRVSYKQLSLETTEVVVSTDQKQRRIAALLEEMSQRIKQLEDAIKQKRAQ
ncbi:MAG TPA: hypothetical protein VFU37_12835 [Pyrinomonadaceae bacterium]|nr:hypothetical protein [Pyrinomonadaceae bacterium]